MTAKFKVGDKVRLKYGLVRSVTYGYYGFSGGPNDIFTIREVSEGTGYITYSIKGHNWCKEKWLELASPIFLGGE